MATCPASSPTRSKRSQTKSPRPTSRQSRPASSGLSRPAKAYRADFKVDQPDGGHRWIQARGVVQYDADGPAGSYSRHSDQHHRPQGGPAAARRPEQPAGTAQQARPPRHPQRGVFDHDAGRTVRVRASQPPKPVDSLLVIALRRPETDPKTEIDERAAQIAASSGRITDLTQQARRTHVGHLVAGRLFALLQSTYGGRFSDREIASASMIDPAVTIRRWGARSRCDGQRTARRAVPQPPNQCHRPQRHRRPRGRRPGSPRRNGMYNCRRQRSGYPEADRESVFTEGKTLPGSDGTGFGLYLVDAHRAVRWSCHDQRR